MSGEGATTRPTFAVVTDSTSDIAPSMAAEYGIAVVPLNVTFGDETFADGVLGQQEFFDRMRTAPELPTTSQPSAGAFVEAYQKALDIADQVVSVHISEKLSGTMASATQAAQEFAGKVHVFDSLNLSWGLGLQVIEAANAAREGLPVEAALERLDDARKRTRLIVGLDSLDNLARGGRIGKVSAFLGSMLDLKVTLTVNEIGEFVPVQRSRGEKAALKHTVDWVEQQMGDAKRAAVAVGHALSEQRALKLKQAIEERLEVTRMVVYKAGSVISTHTGTGWGVAILPEG